MTLATGSVDRSIRIHDLRAPLAVARAQSSAAAGQTSSNVSAVLMGHQFAVRKIAWSPHSAELLASASYDLSARLWRVGEVGAGRPEGHVEVARHEGHTEFVVGAAWSLFEPGLLATCSWDQTVHLLKGPV